MTTTDIRGATVDAADPPVGTNPSPTLAIKTPVRVASTGSPLLPNTGGLLTVDGVALNAGDRVLVKDETDQTTNGIYNAATGPWTRTIDANNNSQWATGTQTAVTQGALNANIMFICQAAGPITLGQTALIFGVTNVAAGSLAAGSYTLGQAGGSFWSDVGTAYIQRIHDRLFVDQGTLNDGGFHGGIASPLQNVGAGAALNAVGWDWLATNASTYVVSRSGIAVVGQSVAVPSLGGVTIGVAAMALNNATSGSAAVWGGYSEGLQEGAFGITFAHEFDIGNTQSTGVYQLYALSGNGADYNTVGVHVDREVRRPELPIPTPRRQSILFLIRRSSTKALSSFRTRL